MYVRITSAPSRPNPPFLSEKRKKKNHSLFIQVMKNRATYYTCVNHLLSSSSVLWPRPPGLRARGSLRVRPPPLIQLMVIRKHPPPRFRSRYKPRRGAKNHHLPFPRHLVLFLSISRIKKWDETPTQTSVCSPRLGSSESAISAPNTAAKPGTQARNRADQRPGGGKPPIHDGWTIPFENGLGGQRGVDATNAASHAESRTPSLGRPSARSGIMSREELLFVLCQGRIHRRARKHMLGEETSKLINK